METWKSGGNGYKDDDDEQLWRQQGRGAVEPLTELLGEA